MTEKIHNTSSIIFLTQNTWWYHFILFSVKDPPKKSLQDLKNMMLDVALQGILVGFSRCIPQLETLQPN